MCGRSSIARARPSGSPDRRERLDRALTQSRSAHVTIHVSAPTCCRNGRSRVRRSAFEVLRAGPRGCSTTRSDGGSEQLADPPEGVRRALRRRRSRRRRADRAAAQRRVGTDAGRYQGEGRIIRPRTGIKTPSPSCAKPELTGQPASRNDPRARALNGARLADGSRCSGIGDPGAADYEVGIRDWGPVERSVLGTWRTAARMYQDGVGTAC